MVGKPEEESDVSSDEDDEESEDSEGQYILAVIQMW